MQIQAPPPSDDDYPSYDEPAGDPPAEALLATRAAAGITRRMQQSGRHLRFSIVPPPACVEILLCDGDGLPLDRITPSCVLEIATGAPVVGGS